MEESSKVFVDWLEYYYPLQKYKVVVEIGYYYKQVDEKPNLQEEAFDTEAN